MTDDELIDHLRRSLTTRASGVTSRPDAWETFQQRVDATMRPAPSPSRRTRWLPVGVAGVALAAAVAFAIVRSSSPAASKVHAFAPAATGQPSGPVGSQPPGSQGPVASAAPTSSPAAVPGPAGGPVPKGFTAMSVTFVSTRDGWVLGTAPCAVAPCTSLLRTSDGGTSWAGIPAPRSPLSQGAAPGISRVRFANLNDGWVFGPDLWATHDGGAHWTRLSLSGVPPSAAVSDLEAAAGVVHAAILVDGGSVRIETSPVAHDSWKASPTTVPLGAGPVPTTQIVLQGQAGWLIEVDHTVVGGARLDHGHWVPWQPPCAAAGGPAVLTASTPANLVAVCDEGVWSGPPQGEHVYVSADGGTSFRRASAAVPLRSGTAVASPVAPTVVAAGIADDGAASLVASFDGGATWTTAARFEGGGSWSDLGFTSHSQGVAVEAAPGSQTGALLMTVDGGHRWTPVPFQPGVR